MPYQEELVGRAESLPVEIRKRVLTSLKEVELHEYLKELFQRMDPNSIVEVTHGPNEFGKDLVLLRSDSFGQNVVAVVVKVGDIRAKTAGKIDEIISQVKQAREHSVKLKIVGSPLKVSTVWVVLDGEISNNAHDRLHKEVDVSAIYDIAWLVEKFSQYYPQIFFEGRITDFLHKKVQELENSHLFASKNIPLSKYFVDPIVAAVDIPVTFDEEQFALVLQKNKKPFSFLSSLVKNRRRIILSGDPGVGKSVALKKLAIDMFKKASNRTIRRTRADGDKRMPLAVPILVTAKDVMSYETPVELQRAYFKTPEVIDRVEVEALFVDGLDEANPDIRSEVLERALDFASQLNCALIITSRKIDLIKSAPAGFEKYELLPFEFSQALQFLDKVIADTQVLEVLKDGLDAIKFQMALTPLSLYLLLEIAEAHKEIPASIVELYDRYCDLVLGRYDREKGIEVLFDYVVKKRFLSSLAYREFYEKNRLAIPDEDMKCYLENYVDIYGWEERLEDFLRDLERSGILDMQNRQAITFRHRSFLDYFTAYYLVENREEFDDIDQKIADIYFDDTWSDVSLFYVGLRRDIKDTVLSRIFSHEDGNIVIHINKLLVGRLLQAAWHATKKVKVKGVQAASDYIVTTRDKFLSLAHSTETQFPEIYADWFVLTLAEYSFGSGMLRDVVEHAFEDLGEEQTFENIYKMVALLWALKRFFDEQTLRAKVDTILNAMSESTLSPLEQSIVLLLLGITERQDKSLFKSIRKRLRKLSRRYPALFKKLLPSSQYKPQSLRG